ncbi:MAG: recombinase RecA [Candidatus Methanoperedens sp.]|nr:recombinase RecA [Candidatus Methanoperedens sp.]PKL53157.1 MAG: recombinase RecA [Candidatus Methanoperedenaceae archaeon HGW-Methanoperedenaceae-1]
MAENLISCGFPVIDNELGGGLKKGSLIYVIADSMSAAEVFLYYFIQNRKTYYLNTDRKPEYIKENIDNLGFDTSLLTFIDAHKEYYEIEHTIHDHGMGARDYMILDFVEKQLGAIKEKDVNLVIDNITFFYYLEVKRVLIQELIDVLYNTAKKTGGLGFIFGIKDEPRPSIENEVINRCDVVLDISSVKKPDRIITELTIPKARDRPIRGTILRFKVEKGVIMDTSREIA